MIIIMNYLLPIRDKADFDKHPEFLQYINYNIFIMIQKTFVNRNPSDRSFWFR